MNEVATRQPTALATTTPSDLLRIAVESNADLDKLQKLMDLQDRWEANQARKAYVEAMAAFKAEPIKIVKRKEVSFESRSGDSKTSYKHAELSDVTEALNPAMAKHGLSYRWDVHQSGSAITVDCIITHVAGHSEKVTMTGGPDATGNKNAIQQIASAVTYLQRYTLLAATGTSTAGEDDDGAAATITAAQYAALVKLMAEVNLPTEKLTKHLKIESLDQILATNFDSVMRLVETKRPQQKVAA